MTILVKPRPLPPSEAAKVVAERKPEWLRVRAPGGVGFTTIRAQLREKKLHTVCEEARCPNLAECWASGTATILIGGDTCTRACRFCAVKTARRPPPLDPDEPAKVAASVASLGLAYVVLTSVDRDDLADQGAGHFASTIGELKARDAAVVVEALVPDFRGERARIREIVESGVDVYAHNVETVERLQLRVRDPRAGYAQSLETLRQAKSLRPSLVTKSSLMLGFGETEDEVLQTMDDLRLGEVDVLTLGQYLRPTREHLPVEKFWRPEEFDRLADAARARGFRFVAAGPLVRSSYRASELFLKGLISNSRKGERDAVQAT